MSKRESRPFRRRFGKKPFRRSPPVTTEEKIKNFVIRNSQNGFFTKMSTISFKFEIPEDEANAILAGLLADNILECVHNNRGEAKLCQAGHSFEVRQNEMVRKAQKKSTKSSSPQKQVQT